MFSSSLTQSSTLPLGRYQELEHLLGQLRFDIKSEATLVLLHMSVLDSNPTVNSLGFEIRSCSLGFLLLKVSLVSESRPYCKPTLSTQHPENCAKLKPLRMSWVNLQHAHVYKCWGLVNASNQQGPLGQWWPLDVTELGFERLLRG